jgi:hypothetical protein
MPDYIARQDDSDKNKGWFAAVTQQPSYGTPPAAPIRPRLSHEGVNFALYKTREGLLTTVQLQWSYETHDYSDSLRNRPRT